MSVYRIQTESGHVDVSRNVIWRIIAEVVERFDGKIMLSNSKGKVVTQSKKAGGMDRSDCLEVSEAEDGLEIHLNVVLRFGISISSVTEQMIQSIQKDFIAYLGMEAAHISIRVAGILSKQIVRRNIMIHSYKKNQ